uniref:Normal mucosa of esophagus-specific 1 n=1 Tax=Malurus cyaneus samueli TaxID=2593467 RepID=A0A8C5THN6_9PASS
HFIFQLIPLAGILTMAAAGAFSFCIYSLFKPDVIVHKFGSPEPWEEIDPSKPQKVICAYNICINCINFQHNESLSKM